LFGAGVVLVCLLEIERREAMAVGNDVTSSPLCVLSIWAVLAVFAGGLVCWPPSSPGAGLCG